MHGIFGGLDSLDMCVCMCAGGVGRRLRLHQKMVNISFQFDDFVCDCILKNLIINDVIAMYDDVAETDDSFEVSYLC